MKVLIVGLGAIAKKHIHALRTIDPEVELYAFRSALDAPAYENVTNIYEEELLANYKFGFAILSTPTARHAKGLKMLIKLGCPLFIEKPLYHTLEVADIVEEISRKGIITYTGCNLRFLECLQFIHHYLDESRRINEVNVYCGSYLPGWRPGIDYKTCYSAIPALGGGVHIDLIHEIDYLYWLFGKPLAASSLFTKKSTLEIDAYDYANYCLQYPGFNASVILNYYRKDAKRIMEIVLAGETIQVDLLKNEVVNSAGDILFRSDRKIIDTYTSQMNYFIDKIRAGKHTFNTVRDAYEVLLILLKNISQ